MPPAIFPVIFSGELQESDTQMILSGIETQLDAAVWFVSRDGNMIASAHSGEYPSAPDTIKDFDPAESGSDRSQTGDYHGYFDNDVITVTVPVTYGYFPKGYLMIHQYTTVVDTMTDILMRGVYITFIVIFLLSFIILLAFHFLVYRPLHKITEAATQYASGNLEYEIPVTTEDEMGYLSASLNYMSSQLRDMEDYQKKFVANVSTIFRSPLTSIKGYIEAMTDGTIPPELHEKYLKIILFETERLTDLTHDLLTLNEFDTNHLLLNREVFDIHEMIKHVAASFEGVCTQKKISIELIFRNKASECKMPTNVKSSKSYTTCWTMPLNSAIRILLLPSKQQTAVKKYIQQSKIMGSEFQERHSEKTLGTFLTKCDLSRGKDKKGTGLGLAIVKEAVQAHGENITVVSTEGVGTEFSIFTSESCRLM